MPFLSCFSSSSGMTSSVYPQSKQTRISGSDRLTATVSIRHRLCPAAGCAADCIFQKVTSLQTPVERLDIWVTLYRIAHTSKYAVILTFPLSWDLSSKTILPKNLAKIRAIGGRQHNQGVPNRFAIPVHRLS